MSAECNLTWRTFSQHLQSVFRDLYEQGSHSDITLICEDQVQFRAHKIVLSACSPVFRNIIDSNPSQHPLVYLRGIQAQDMKAVLQFMYLGEGRFYQERIGEFFKVANDLEVKDINIGGKSNCDNMETVEASNNESEDQSSINIRSSPNQELEKATDKQKQLDVSEDESLKVDLNYQLDESESGASKYETEEKDNRDGESEEEKEKIEVEEEEERREEEEDRKGEEEEKRRGGEEDEKIRVAEKEEEDRIKSEAVVTVVRSGEDVKPEALEIKLLNIKDLSIDPDYPVCPECGALFTKKSSVVTHYKAFHLGITYQCDQCEYTARDKRNLDRHIQVRHGLRYPCDKCDYRGSDKCRLKRHIQARHENIRYPCLQCDHKFRDKSGLKAHVKSKHEGIKHSCAECGKNFSAPGSLFVHMRTIHGDQSYPCDQCGHEFSQLCNLKVHMKVRHGYNN